MPDQVSPRQRFIATERGSAYCAMNALHNISEGRFLDASKKLLKKNYIHSVDGVINFVRNENNIDKARKYLDRELSFGKCLSADETRLRNAIYVRTLVMEDAHNQGLKKGLNAFEGQTLEMEAMERLLIDQGAGKYIPE